VKYIILYLLIAQLFNIPIHVAASETCLSVDYEFWYATEFLRVDSRVAVNYDGTILAVARRNGTFLYDTHTLQALGVLERTYVSSSFDIDWSPDENLIADASFSIALRDNYDLPPELASSLTIWDAETQEIRNMLNTQTNVVAWSPDGEFIVYNQINNGLGGMIISQADNLEPIAEIDTYTVLSNLIWLIDTSGLIGTYDGHVPILLWREDIGAIHIDTDYSITYGSTNIHTDLATFVTYSQVLLWSLETQELVASVLPEPYSNTFSAEWSPDGESIAFTTFDGLFLWYPFNDERLVDYTDGAPPAYQIAWQPDGEALFYSDFDGNVYRWDMTLECVTGYIEHNEEQN